MAHPDAYDHILRTPFLVALHNTIIIVEYVRGINQTAGLYSLSHFAETHGIDHGF